MFLYLAITPSALASSPTYNNLDSDDMWLPRIPSVVSSPYDSIWQEESKQQQNAQQISEPASEKRMVHNAMERVRRETLNTKFQELAYALPTLRTVRRPSKSQIVQRALEFVRTAFVQEKLYQNQITTLKRENELLIAQLDTIRDKLSNQLNADAFGIPAKVGDADFVLDDFPPLQQQQHVDDEDDQSTESWEYDAFGLANKNSIYVHPFMGLYDAQSSIPQPSTSYDHSGLMAFDIQGFNAREYFKHEAKPIIHTWSLTQNLIVQINASKA
ncbi:unnamed protein product [Umbelopsis vinacea]